MKRVKISKLALICLIIVFVLGTGLFLYLKYFNHASADEAVKNDQTSQSKTAIAETENDDLQGFSSAPILMYHYIRVVSDSNDTLGANLSVSPENFNKQLDYLQANNYQTISLAQLRDGFAGNYKITKTKKPVVITFDDGYDDAYTQAYQILKSHNMTGVFYIITGQIGQSERMTNSQIIELDRAGMIIGSHTKNHLDVSTLASSQLEIQLSESKSYLEQLLGHPIVDFCYPAGKYNANDIAVLKNDNYLTATTTKAGIANTKSSLFELPRIRMQNNSNLANLLNN